MFTMIEMEPDEPMCPRCFGLGKARDPFEDPCGRCGGTGFEVAVEMELVPGTTVTRPTIDWEDFALPGLPVDEDVSLEPGFYAKEGTITFLNTDGTVRSEAVPVSHVKITTTTTGSGTGFSTTGWPTIPAYPPIAIDPGPPPVPPRPPVTAPKPDPAPGDTVQLNARVTRAMRARLKKQAASGDRTVQELVRDFIDEGLDNAELVAGATADSLVAITFDVTALPHVSGFHELVSSLKSVAAVHGWKLEVSDIDYRTV